ncbi:Large tegument protein deneddylase [Bienertia sinuspersici]
MNSSRFLNSLDLSTHKIPNQTPEEEFDECDVVWSSSFDGTPTTTTTDTVTPSTVVSPSTAAGLSTALLSTNEARSPTSIQRKTTSSPVSMISSSSLGRDGGSRSYYYGRNFHQSAPVNVPLWPSGLGRNRPGFGLGQFDEIDDFRDDGEMVPPHEIVARSHNASSFSVFEGAGRTLKGRDLTTVRNSVFQKTGFL